MFGWRRRGAYWSSPVSAKPGQEQAGGPPDDHPDRVDEISFAIDVPAERQEHERNGEQEADAEREQEGPAVLHERGAVALDPVDPVRRALDLAERRRRRDERADQPDRQREEAVAGTDLARLLHGVREQVAGEARHRVLNGVDDHPAHLEVAERGREADQRDQPLDEHERHHEGERARVTEAVGVPQARECVGDEAQPPGVHERLAGVVARQLPRLRDAGRGAHDATGTQISTAPGSTSISNDFTFSRSPPSSW